jgi:hypothetical protein
MGRQGPIDEIESWDDATLAKKAQEALQRFEKRSEQRETGFDDPEIFLARD